MEKVDKVIVINSKSFWFIYPFVKDIAIYKTRLERLMHCSLDFLSRDSRQSEINKFVHKVTKLAAWNLVCYSCVIFSIFLIKF